MSRFVASCSPKGGHAHRPGSRPVPPACRSNIALAIGAIDFRRPIRQGGARRDWSGRSHAARRGRDRAGHRAFGELVLAQEERVAGILLGGALQTLAQFAAQAELDMMTRGAQLLRQLQRCERGTSPIGTTAIGRGVTGVAASSIASRSIPAAQPMPGVSGRPWSRSARRIDPRPARRPARQARSW